MEIRKWGWMGFPVVVGLTVLFSARWLVAGPDQIWQKLWLTNVEVGKAESEVVRLKEKLNILNNTDVAGQKEILMRLEAAVPGVRRTELLIRGVTQAASESGVAVERYGAGGDETQQVLQVTLRTGDAWKFIDWVGRMERWLPLLKIVDASYKNGRAEVAIEQEWRAATVSGARAEDDLPEMAGRVQEALQKISNYREISLGGAQDPGGVNPSPF